MTNSRAKGARYETAVNHHLVAELGQRWTRTNRSGFNGDDGDIDGAISIEAKNHARLELGAWIDQAHTNAGGRIAAVIHKRRGRTDVGDHYVTMTVADFIRLITEHHT